MSYTPKSKRKPRKPVGKTEATIEEIRRDFNKLIDDEIEAISAYKQATKAYGDYGWRKLFSNILEEEEEHLEKLRISLKAIEDTWKKTRRYPHDDRDYF